MRESADLGFRTVAVQGGPRELPLLCSHSPNFGAPDTSCIPQAGICSFWACMLAQLAGVLSESLVFAPKSFWNSHVGVQRPHKQEDPTD